jgi:ethanolamine utilization cobalamin adenosyltransferase
VSIITKVASSKPVHGEVYSIQHYVIKFVSNLLNYVPERGDYMLHLDGWFMVFNAIFNNISVISWRSVLWVMEIGVPEETTNLSQVTDKLDHTEII